MPSSQDTLVVKADQVAELLPIDVAVRTQRRAFSVLSSREAVSPERLLLPGSNDAVAFCYASRLESSTSAVCKFGSVNGTNTNLGLPSVSAVVVVLDEETGAPACIIDGTSITTRRTAAASAVAVIELTSHKSVTLGVLGSGVQAEAHVRALAEMHDLEDVLIFGIDATETRILCERLGADLNLSIRQARSAQETVTNSTVVVTCTTSAAPVVDSSWVKPGTTLVTVGSFAPDRCEVPVDLMARSDLLVVDHGPTALAQAGNICAAKASGHPVDVVEIGSVINGDHPGRRDEEEIIVYTSVGVGVQDAAAAEAITEAARHHPDVQMISLT